MLLLIQTLYVGSLLLLLPVRSQKLLLGSEDSQPAIYDLNSRALDTTVDLSDDFFRGITSMSNCPDGRILATFPRAGVARMDPRYGFRVDMEDVDQEWTIVHPGSLSTGPILHNRDGEDLHVLKTDGTRTALSPQLAEPVKVAVETSDWLLLMDQSGRGVSYSLVYPPRLSWVFDAFPPGRSIYSEIVSYGSIFEGLIHFWRRYVGDGPSIWTIETRSLTNNPIRPFASNTNHSSIASASKAAKGGGMIWRTGGEGFAGSKYLWTLEPPSLLSAYSWNPINQSLTLEETFTSQVSWSENEEYLQAWNSPYFAISNGSNLHIWEEQDGLMTHLVSHDELLHTTQPINISALLWLPLTSSEPISASINASIPDAQS